MAVEERVVIMVNTIQWEAQTNSSINSKTWRLPYPTRSVLNSIGFEIRQMCVAFRVSSKSNIRVDCNTLPYK